RPGVDPYQLLPCIGPDSARCGYPLRHQNVVLAETVGVRQYADDRKADPLVKSKRVAFRLSQLRGGVQHVRVQVPPVNVRTAKVVVGAEPNRRHAGGSCFILQRPHKATSPALPLVRRIHGHWMQLPLKLRMANGTDPSSQLIAFEGTQCEPVRIGHKRVDLLHRLGHRVPRGRNVRHGLHENAGGLPQYIFGQLTKISDARIHRPGPSPALVVTSSGSVSHSKKPRASIVRSAMNCAAAQRASEGAWKNSAAAWPNCSSRAVSLAISSLPRGTNIPLRRNQWRSIIVTASCNSMPAAAGSLPATSRASSYNVAT